ncbi:MAG: PEP/pyruvate-binding domain-containing protein [Acidobacteriota bacterium]
MIVRGFRFFRHQTLTPFRVRDVLLVASLYDRFILEEDGRFADKTLEGFAQLELSSPPDFTHVTSAREALDRLSKGRYDLVLATPHCGDMTPRELAWNMPPSPNQPPVAMLAYDEATASEQSQRPRSDGLDQVFLWNGDPRLGLALVKAVEDSRNVGHDTEHSEVRVILLVEDSPSFYSSYLPLIYNELLLQLQHLFKERHTERDRRHRIRARPKILLARNYEEAMLYFEKYQRYLLGTICDLRFPRRGRMDPMAGRDFIRQVRRRLPDLPVLLQTRGEEHRRLAQELSVRFADKTSPDLNAQLRSFIRTDFGFGPFVFRQRHDRKAVTQAADIQDMVRVLPTVPRDVLIYHAEHNHLSNWLMARGEFSLAEDLRPRKVSDFADGEALRQYLIQSFARFLEERAKGEVGEFSSDQNPLGTEFFRIGTGSMGGKARGMAFLSRLLAESEVHERFPGVKIAVPRTGVLCTDIFESYIERDDLQDRALAAQSDEEVVALFLERPLEPKVMQDLAALLEGVRYPLAVRSSSIHEDSEFQPLAGLYRTFMIPNAVPELRLEQLSRAVRLVFASVFLRSTRNYLKAHGLRVGDERMAVILQRLVGRHHGDRFYPHFAGVAQSHNYYPQGKMRPEDGIVTVALGLGQSIVDGGRVVRFCPRYPAVPLQMGSIKDALRFSQRHFYALDMADPRHLPEIHETTNLVRLDLEVAEADGTLDAVGATYSPDNDAIYDSIHRPGTRLVNFSGVLKHGVFPLAPLLEALLELGREGMGTPVEMEFAVDLAAQTSVRPGRALEGAVGEVPEMAPLQLRPLVASTSGEVEVDLARLPVSVHRLLEGEALGYGVRRGLEDVIYLHPRRYDPARGRELAAAIERLDHRLRRQDRSYVLLGPGRWGTADPWLGVPVDWPQVAGAALIAELELEGSGIDPSQGSHFFHNLTSLRVGYLCVRPHLDSDRADLEGLEALESLAPEVEPLGLRWVRLPRPYAAHLDAAARRGAVIPDNGPRSL